jgi:hypothetical protein
VEKNVERDTRVVGCDEIFFVAKTKTASRRGVKRCALATSLRRVRFLDR